MPNYKRELESSNDLDFVDGNLIADNGNSPRPLSEEEIHQLGYTKCATLDCHAELAIRKEQKRKEALALLDLAESGVSTAASSLTTVHQQPASKATPTIEHPPATTSGTRSDTHRRRHARHTHHHGKGTLQHER
jgi:hypothetical protein